MLGHLGDERSAIPAFHHATQSHLIQVYGEDDDDRDYNGHDQQVYPGGYRLGGERSDDLDVACSTEVTFGMGHGYLQEMIAFFAGRDLDYGIEAPLLISLYGLFYTERESRRIGQDCFDG